MPEPSLPHRLDGGMETGYMDNIFIAALRRYSGYGFRGVILIASAEAAPRGAGGFDGPT